MKWPNRFTITTSSAPHPDPLPAGERGSSLRFHSLASLSHKFPRLCRDGKHSVHLQSCFICSHQTRERLGRITVIPPRPRTPGQINRPLKRQTSVLSPSPGSAEMRSRRSQPPAVPDVRTLASRRENRGDLSRNRASLLACGHVESHSRCKSQSHALVPGSHRPRLCPNSGGFELSGAGAVRGMAYFPLTRSPCSERAGETDPTVPRYTPPAPLAARSASRPAAQG
jgi:hypothetical protein